MVKAPTKRGASQSVPGLAAMGPPAPAMVPDMNWQSIGSSGLRQYSGWVREEFLPQLTGRQAARTYREMMDNSPTVGSILFAIQQSMRQVSWRVETPDDSPRCAESADFLESCMGDMTETWPDFISESLSMLPYGFAPHEIVYKRRSGEKRKSPNGSGPASSRYSDGLIGWDKLALRGQDTVIKWFFDSEGEPTGMTQQPWFGGQIDIPIEKLLLFRPRAWKNNPEGYSILRSAYRPWWFLKRLEEQEAIALERMSGTPEYRVPNDLLELAAAGDENAIASLNAFKSIVTGIKVDEQMGLITPSDTFMNADGTRSAVPAYEFRYNVPNSRSAVDFDKPIQRYKLDIMTSVLADFLTLGHGARGSQSLANTKVDLFFQATEGWLESNTTTINDFGVKRLWSLNGFPEETMPTFVQDVPKRADLDTLGTYILQMTQAGARLFPDDDLENYLRDVADLPELTGEMLADQGFVTNPTVEAQASGDDPAAPPAQTQVQKHVAGMLSRRLAHAGYLPRRAGPDPRSGIKKRRGK